jgi:hypothetical protein
MPLLDPARLAGAPVRFRRKKDSEPPSVKVKFASVEKYRLFGSVGSLLTVRNV